MTDSPLEYVCYVRVPGEIWLINDKRIVGVHTKQKCREPGFGGKQLPCVIHAPTDHHMSSWSLIYRDDRNLFERLCEHGVSHPDPDQIEYWISTRQDHMSIHGCDGCCQPTDKTERGTT